MRCFKLNHSQVFNVDIFILYFPIHVYNKQNCNKYLLYWMLNSLVCVFVSYFIHLGLLHRSLYYKGLNFHISPILWVLNRLTAIWHKNNSLGSKWISRARKTKRLNQLKCYGFPPFHCNISVPAGCFCTMWPLTCKFSAHCTHGNKEILRMNNKRLQSCFPRLQSSW